MEEKKSKLLKLQESNCRKKEEGVTLVALLITIIIIIIISAVVIKSMKDSDIIELAVKGAENYIDAQEYENKEMDNIVIFLKERIKDIDVNSDETNCTGDEFECDGTGTIDCITCSGTGTVICNRACN